MSRTRFTYAEAERIAKRMGLERNGQVWRGTVTVGGGERSLCVQIHTHRGGDTIPTGTLRSICRQFGFTDLEAMKHFYDRHCS